MSLFIIFPTEFVDDFREDFSLIFLLWIFSAQIVAHFSSLIFHWDQVFAQWKMNHSQRAVFVMDFCHSTIA